MSIYVAYNSYGDAIASSRYIRDLDFTMYELGYEMDEYDVFMVTP